MDELLSYLKRDYPQLQFTEGVSFCWSPISGQIFYSIKRKSLRPSQYSILHEVAHAFLGHTKYATDYELLLIEIAAWEHAKTISQTYDIVIDDDYIQDCLDSYRDWLYKRSICPTCGSKSAQCDEATHYQCFNCHGRWHVATSKFCRPYRHQQQKKSPVVLTTGDLFDVDLP